VLVSNFVPVNCPKEVDDDDVFSEVIWLKAELCIVYEVKDSVKMASNYLLQDFRDDWFKAYNLIYFKV
jgi:hypothetical protein